MELYELRALLTVADEGNFRRAAAVLNRSASTISSHIRQLERDIGTQLVDRTDSGAVLTPAGRALVDETRGTADALDRAAVHARRIAATGHRRIRIGHNGAASLDVVRRALVVVLAADPAVRVHLHEGTTAELARMLADNEVDLAVLRRAVSDERIHSARLREERLTVALRKDHPLAAAKTIALSDLAGMTLLLPPRSQAASARDDVLDACWEHGGFRPTDIQEATTTAGLLTLVAAGAGAAILPQRSCSCLRTPGVRVVKVTDPLPTLPVHLAWRRRETDCQVLKMRQALLDAG